MFENVLRMAPSAMERAETILQGDRVRIVMRAPLGQRRVPFYLRGSVGTVLESVEPRDAGAGARGVSRDPAYHRSSYRISIPMTLLWRDYEGSNRDELRIDVDASWLERVR